MQIKGLKDIRTSKGMLSRAMPRTKARMVAELAFLEHQREKLEREVALWAHHEGQARDQLRRIEQRAGVLWEGLGRLGVSEAEVSSHAPAVRTHGPTAVTLEY